MGQIIGPTIQISRLLYLKYDGKNYLAKIDRLIKDNYIILFLFKSLIYFLIIDKHQSDYIKKS